MIEREPNFESLYTHLTKAYRKECADNLSITVDFVCGDALRYRSEYGNNYDLIIESNMLNHSEDASDDAIDGFMKTAVSAVGDYGFIIFVEPGTNEDYALLKSLPETCSLFIVREKPSRIAVDISQISLYSEAVSAGLRIARKQEHWFSYAVLEKR